MRDYRVKDALWTADSKINNATQSINGKTFDLRDGYVMGAHPQGTGKYGVGVVCLCTVPKALAAGSGGDGFTVTFKFQTSADNGTSWDDAGEIGTIAVDANAKFLDNDDNPVSLGRMHIDGRLHTARGKFRVVATGGSVGATVDEVVTNVYFADGTKKEADYGIRY